MKRRVAVLIDLALAVSLTACILSLGLTGCEVSKPYVMKVDRKDQTMEEGNRGYLRGTPPPAKDRTGLKREYLALDIDISTGDESSPQAASGTAGSAVSRETTVVSEEVSVQETATAREEVK
jgi:hypothetical protein